jgi:hypothetical protein
VDSHGSVVDSHEGVVDSHGNAVDSHEGPRWGEVEPRPEYRERVSTSSQHNLVSTGAIRILCGVKRRN